MAIFQRAAESPDVNQALGYHLRSHGRLFQKSSVQEGLQHCEFIAARKPGCQLCHRRTRRRLVIGGSRLVRTYDWDTVWNIDAPLATVYRVMTTPKEQVHWWPSMQVHT